MTLLILSVCLFVFTIVFTVFYNLAKNADLKKRRLNSIKGKSKNEIDEDLELPFFQRVIIPLFTSALKSISNLFPKNKRNKTQKTEKNLRLAGFNIAVNEYNAARLMFSGALVLLALIFNWFIHISFILEFLILLLSLMFSIVAPGLFLKIMIGSRQEEIKNQLPDVMDLLCVSMEAGLGFDAALVKIGERLKGLLVSELNTVHTEIQLGKPRRDALRSLADRSPVEELTTFVGSIIQAEQLGIPINNVLKTQAQELRVKRRQRAEAKAMKAPVKMMLPLIIFVFPVLFIILLGPTIIQLVGQFGG